MNKLLIIYWSQTGHVESMAKACEEGAKAAGATDVKCIKVTELTKTDLENYEVFIWGTGNYFQTMAGMIWDFFCRYHYDLLKMPKAQKKAYACVVSAGIGGAMCLDGLNHRLQELKWKRVFDTVVAFEEPKPEILEKCRELGRKMVLVNPAEAADLNPPRKPRFEWPEYFRIIAWSGVGVEVARSWTKFLAEDTKMKIVITPESNTVNRFKWTGLKMYQLTAGGTTETSQMLMADRKYAARDAGPWPIRAVWAQSKSCSGMFVRGDSPIRTPYDIKPGTRVADMSSYAASVRIVEAYLAWGKVDKKDVIWVPGNNYPENVRAVVEGRADVCFGIPTSPSIEEAEKNPHGIRWLEYNPNADPEGYKRFIAIDPLVTFGQMHAGVPSCLGVWSNVGVSLYTCHAEISAMMITRLCRWLDENYEKYKSAHPWNRWMSLDTLVEELEHTFIPAHEGLVRFLTEKGIWTPTHADRQKQNVELIDRYVRAYQEAKDMADAKGIAVLPENQQWIDLWENYKKQLNLPPFRLFKSLKEA